MNENQPKPQKRFYRIGLKGLIALVLLLGLVFGGLARWTRQVQAQEFLISELVREHVYPNHRFPTWLCFTLMRLQGKSSLEVEQSFRHWLSASWFSTPIGFNAGMLPEAKVKPLVKQLQTFGSVNEVIYRSGGLEGLRLFYIGETPLQNLGPEASHCAFRSHGSSSESLEACCVE